MALFMWLFVFKVLVDELTDSSTIDRFTLLELLECWLDVPANEDFVLFLFVG